MKVTPTTAQIPGLQSDMTPLVAMRAAVSESLRHLQANVPGVLESDDVEFVHQARVALRRLRSAQKAFAAIANDDDWKVIVAEAQWFAALLGTVRDLDVFLVQTLPPIEAALAREGDFNQLRAAVTKRRNTQRRKLRVALTSARYGQLRQHLLEWLDKSTSTPASSSETLAEFAHKSLSRRWRQVDRLVEQWQLLSREQRHELRKRTKKLRYAAEFFSSLYKTKPLQRYLARLQALQQILGTMNDDLAGQALLDQLILKDDGLKPAAELVIGWLVGESQRAETELERAITKLKDTRQFW